MDEILSHATFEFHQSILSGRWALRVFLGYRNQSDGKTVTVWAYIYDDPTGGEPPIVFRDGVPTNLKGVTTTRLYPRAASSLLRKASQLRPPFCFLQQELDEGAKDGRGMLCAVVSYYGLISGSSDCAMRWPRFDACLMAAFDYISTTVGVSVAKQAVQHEKTSETTEATRSKLSMALCDTAWKRKVPGAALVMNPIPEGGDRGALPTNFANRDHRYYDSLILRLKLNRQALANITGINQTFDLPEDQDEPMGAVASFCDSVHGNSADSVIGDDVDSVIGNFGDDASQNDRMTHCRTTSKKRKLDSISKGSDGKRFGKTNGCRW
ncbi:hypothetical protein GT037_009243 [Alternaria burnsii]|uniref:Uncharacterized protein n=1 Tax=Alternaria burnsii TaxID=1187904 RepID=A0A8H7B0G2_9PLEO|nr:uncharacterized protein GT037_009243 [Alternaria burnsii]KAF7672742.1 hypothetical protein GT037_009243 [Alternaria burnsii]